MRSEDRIHAILAADAIAFKPLITIREDGSVEGIDGFESLESPGLFSQFASHPRLFQDFVLTHWHDFYSAFFVFQASPISPHFTCCAVHVMQPVNGKEKPETVRKLEHIKELLIQKGLNIVDYAFNGDFCYDRLHREFENIWRCESHQLADPGRLFDMPSPPQLACFDLLHIRKRTRYRLVCFDADAETDGHGFFSLRRVRTHVKLQSIVYQGTKTTKTHDSLPLHLFSQRATFTIFPDGFSAEFFVFFPWFLMISARTCTEHSTKIRCTLLENDFWVLWIY
jgi:hypothetical protein